MMTKGPFTLRMITITLTKKIWFFKIITVQITTMTILAQRNDILGITFRADK